MQVLKNIAVVGLGTGVVALYDKPGQQFDFFEIDPAVVDIVRSQFENLTASRAAIRHIIGDARIELRKIPDESYDLLILDAFNSGSIPTHLITIEAMEDLFRVLKPHGLVLYHISNRYVDLLPVFSCVASKMGLLIRHHHCIGDWSTHRYAAHWVLLTKSADTFAAVTAQDPAWRKPPDREVCWSDDFTHLWSVIKLR